MGWNQRGAVGELLHEGDHVKVFRYRLGTGHSIVGEHIGEVVKVIHVERLNYEGRLQICLDFGSGKSGWVHQSSVMKV